MPLRLEDNILDGDRSQLVIGRIDGAGVPSVTLLQVRASHPNTNR